MSSPPPDPITPTRAYLALAAEQRVQQVPTDFAQEQEYVRQRNTRLAFRRLVDPGLVRGNSSSTVRSSMQTLLTIADNILQHQDEDKYRQFKPTNSVIKRTLVDVKGALEYAVALGFRAEVQKFQPLYVFHPTPSRLTDLRIGAEVLREFIQRENDAAEKEARSKAEAKAAATSAAQNVLLAYDDDRKTKKLRDEMEKQRRSARAAAPVALPTLEEPEPEPEPGFSTARLVGGSGPNTTSTNPPPYEEDE